MSCFVLYLYIEKGQMERLLAGFINQADMESDEDDNPVPVKNKAVNVQLPGSQVRTCADSHLSHVHLRDHV